MSKILKLKSMLKETEGVLFDFDNVLADSEEFYYLSYLKGFKKLGYTIDPEDYWKWWSLHGLGIEGECKRKKINLTQKQKEIILKEKNKTYSKFCKEGKIKIIPETWEAMCIIAKSGIKAAIASNSNPEDLETIIRTNRLKSPVPIIGRKDGLKAKPHPDIFIYAAGVLGVTPSSCIVIEDAIKGIKSAKSCKMKCIIIKTKISKTCKFNGADLIFNSASEFLETLKSI